MGICGATSKNSAVGVDQNKKEEEKKHQEDKKDKNEVSGDQNEGKKEEAQEEVQEAPQFDVPKVTTTGFTFPDSKLDKRELKGEMCEMDKMMHDMQRVPYLESKVNPDECKTCIDYVTPIRETFASMTVSYEAPIFKEQLEKADASQIKFEASEFDGSEDKREITVNVYQKKNST